MRIFGRLSVVVLGLMWSAAGFSQDLFSSTNSTVHSYNYVEVQYLPDSEASPPVLASLLIAVADNWSVTGEYQNSDLGNVAELAGLDPNQVEINADAEAMSIGGLYHQRLSFFKNSDWIAGLMFGRGEIVIRSEETQFTREARLVIDVDFQEIYAGVRRTFTAELEGEVTFNISRSTSTLQGSTGVDEEQNDIQQTADVKLVYRVSNLMDVAIAANDIGEGDEFYGIGLRYTW